VAKFAALAQASICEPVHAFGPLRWAHAFEQTSTGRLRARTSSNSKIAGRSPARTISRA